jgi:hypothetical protein
MELRDPASGAANGKPVCNCIISPRVPALFTAEIASPDAAKNKNAAATKRTGALLNGVVIRAARNLKLRR